MDFQDVIKERKKYYTENAGYHMLSADVRDPDWIVKLLDDKNAIIVMEGVSMYIQPDQLKQLLRRGVEHFSKVRILMDCYTTFGAKMSSGRSRSHRSDTRCLNHASLGACDCM